MDDTVFAGVAAKLAGLSAFDTDAGMGVGEPPARDGFLEPGALPPTSLASTCSDAPDMLLWIPKPAALGLPFAKEDAVGVVGVVGVVGAPKTLLLVALVPTPRPSSEILIIIPSKH
ncbi:hypothetical protein GGI12_003408 [Dipsacomyces acuminosporus]|nr:hypothetical protein GGI12_003408 [Dipsacomyces acuminosporus]